MTETAILIILFVILAVGPFALLMIIGGGSISFRKKHVRNIRQFRATEVETKVTEAEILEEMCLLPWITRETLRSGDRLSDAERTIIAKKSFAGKNVFPVRNIEKSEGIKTWLSNPFSRVLIQSMAIDCATMEGILRKVLQESFDSSYQTAKARAIGKNEIMNRAMRQMTEIAPDDWSKRWEILLKAQEGCSDVERGSWRKYLKGRETGEEPDRLEE